ncbi:hypothetical protein BB559_005197 [Furculomyces boomerangus]|uniref:ACB domain-containing protein n=2 Tax=Harpellales TaxID=61421 RepID=A0A2T9YA58_9FUNG|nr:hypothetical protein BB559_005197 [Furculomyces boomerangus]PWA03686.1 hypothetical protein BB558_000144 [Smittium angustum]
MTNAESTGNAAFIQASKDVNTLPTKPANDTLLELYALFKQSIFGDNEDPQPGLFDLKGKAKYNAWKSKAGMSKEEAQAKYIELVDSLMSK